MKAYDHAEFQPEFPELFRWGWLDSPRMEAACRNMSSLIDSDLCTSERLLTPGLREALRQIALVAPIADVYVEET